MSNHNAEIPPGDFRKISQVRGPKSGSSQSAGSDFYRRVAEERERIAQLYEKDMSELRPLSEQKIGPFWKWLLCLWK